MGCLLTVDRLVCRPQEKRALGQKHAALAADMETMAVAEVCRRRETPFLAVRLISDAADDDLSRDVEKLLAQPNGPARLAAAVGSILRRPSKSRGPAAAEATRPGGIRSAGEVPGGADDAIGRRANWSPLPPGEGRRG